MPRALWLKAPLTHRTRWAFSRSSEACWQVWNRKMFQGELVGPMSWEFLSNTPCEQPRRYRSTVEVVVEVPFAWLLRSTLVFTVTNLEDSALASDLRVKVRQHDPVHTDLSEVFSKTHAVKSSVNGQFWCSHFWLSLRSCSRKEVVHPCLDCAFGIMNSVQRANTRK